jgi:hypothetical protein
MCKKIKLIMKIFKDMLTEKGVYSQSRIYLLWAIIAYYITLGVLMFKGVSKENTLDLNKFQIIIDALEYAMVLFAGYTFGGKFLNVVQTIGLLKHKNKEEETTN